MNIQSLRRIGLVFEFSTINGGENSMLAVIDRLHRNDCNFFALTLQPGPLVEELNRRGVHVEIRPEIRNSPESLSSAVREFSYKHKLDIIHANSLTMGRRVGAIASQLQIPTTSHVRDIMKLSGSAVRDLNKVSKLFAVSKATREFHISQGVDEKLITTVYNGVDFDEFRPRPKSGWLKRELKLQNSAFLIASIGQICLRKGQDDFANAMTRLGENCPRLHCVLVGSRYSSKSESIEFDQRIDAVFAEAGMSDRFHRLGFRSDVSQILNEVDVLVHTARQEPLGRVLLEAAASGLPIVATKVGGTEEILTDRESALLVESGDVEQIASAVLQFEQDELLRDRVGAVARESVRQKFDVGSSAHHLWKEWREISRANRSGEQ